MNSADKDFCDGATVRVERSVCLPTLGVRPGARLAQAVRRADGAVLLPAGAELDIDQLRRLMQRGIECVYVLQAETRDAAQIEQDLAAAALRTAHLFRGEGGAARQKLAAVIAGYRRQAVS